MGLFYNSAKEIREKVYDRFGDSENYLLVMKHNDVKSGLLKFIASHLYYTMDSSRTFVLYFSSKGIYEVEISNSLKKEFLLMPWNEISKFDVNTNLFMTIITFEHLGANIRYEVPFEGKLVADNKANFVKLEGNDWNRLSEV